MPTEGGTLRVRSPRRAAGESVIAYLESAGRRLWVRLSETPVGDEPWAESVAQQEAGAEGRVD